MDETKNGSASEPLKEKANKDEKEPWKKETKDDSLSIEELIKKKFNEFKISCLISELPYEMINVIYQSGVKVNLGNTITSYQSRHSPYILYWPVESNKLYSIMFIDIDNLPPNEQAENHFFLIFLACNIYGNDIMKGDIVAEYVPISQANHRILILGFKQESYFKISLKIKKDDREQRSKFSLKDFIEKYNLKMHTGNFFICSN